MYERAGDVHESIRVQWSWSFVIETCQRAEDFQRSSLESSGGVDFDNTGCPAKLFPLLFFEFLGLLGV